MNKDRDKSRTLARIATVQALYQMEISGEGWQKTAEQFSAEWLDRRADGKFFRQLLEGAVTCQQQSDNMSHRLLKEGWPLTRVDSVMRALFRAASYELANCVETPVKVILNEYTNIASRFLAGEKETGLVNGLLHAMANEFRLKGASA